LYTEEFLEAINEGLVKKLK